MAKLRNGTYKTKASPTHKRSLIGQIRAKAAEVAQRTEEAHHQAQKKIYALRSRIL